ncbi:MAG: hypothetical protein RR444_07560 [Oscillospiraceae bacterium]
MKDYSYFNELGSFYKGNLHCHSNRSDGELTVEALIENYKGVGYSFLAFSEHEQFTKNDSLCSDDFITIPAIEWSSDLVTFEPQER